MRRWMLAFGVDTLRLGFGLVIGGAAVAVLPAVAYAQGDIRSVEPYVAVVTVDKAPMRCSNGAQLFYAVRELKSGELVRVNGEGPGWVRVEYLPGMRAYAPASDVEADRDGRTVKLNKPSRLLAVNAEGKSNWWPLELDADLPAGTVLTVADVAKRPDGGTDGYFVQAPPKARGFIKAEQVRKATAEEAARYVGIGQSHKAPDPAGTPAPSAPSPAPAASTAPAVAPAPTAANPAPPGTPPGFNPVTPVAARPEPSTPAPAGAEESQPEPPSVTMAPPPTPAPPPPPPRDEEIEQLRTMFDKVMAAGGDAEVPTVIGMFERKIAKLGAGPKDQMIRTSLSQRLEALKLRQDILAQRDAVRQMSVQHQQTVQRVSMIVAEAQKQAIYNIVGRIQPSTVYDGRRGLPLMYRVESADALSPRTVGYIIPTEGIELLTKIGKVCGIVGESRLDSSLQLNIIAPRRIDVLDVGGTATSPPGVFPEPTANPASAPSAPATVQQPPSVPEPEK